MLKRLKNADLPLVFVIMLLCGFGLLMVYSASDVMGSQRYGDPSYFFHKQSASLLIGLCLFLFAACLPYKRYARLVPLFVVGSLVLLLLVLIPESGWSGIFPAGGWERARLSYSRLNWRRSR